MPTAAISASTLSVHVPGQIAAHRVTSKAGWSRGPVEILRYSMIAFSRKMVASRVLVSGFRFPLTFSFLPLLLYTHLAHSERHRAPEVGVPTSYKSSAGD